MYLWGGDIPNGRYYGMEINPTNGSKLVLGGKIRNTRVTQGYGDRTNSSEVDGITTEVYNDSLSVGTLFEMYPDSISIGSGSGSTTFKGVTYYGDYSGNFVDRSIPDVGWVKGYVDTAVGGITKGSITGATGTSVVVTHGAAYTPAQVMITMTSALPQGTTYFVSGKTSTTFTITFSSSVTTPSFDWLMYQ